jgi:hypothetical protein
MVRMVDARCAAGVDGVDGVFDMTLPESSGRAKTRDPGWWSGGGGAAIRP